MHSSLLARARARLSCELAACAPAPAAIDAPKSHRAQRGSTVYARGRPIQQVAKLQQGAQQHDFGVFVGLLTAAEALRRARASRRRAHAPRCAQRCRCRGCQRGMVCRNVLVSCLCIVMQMCWLVGECARWRVRACRGRRLMRAYRTRAVGCPRTRRTRLTLWREPEAASGAALGTYDLYLTMIFLFTEVLCTRPM